MARARSCLLLLTGSADAQTAAASSPTSGSAVPPAAAAATETQSQLVQHSSNEAVSSSSQLPQAPVASMNINPAGPSASSSAAGPSSASSSNSLNTIDDVCNAILSITLSGGDANAQYKLVSQSLLPALQHLEHRGTSLGVPGSVVLCSPLQGNHDPLQALLTQIPQAGLGLGYLFIL